VFQSDAKQRALLELSSIAAAATMPSRRDETADERAQRLLRSLGMEVADVAVGPRRPRSSPRGPRRRRTFDRVGQVLMVGGRKRRHCKVHLDADGRQTLRSRHALAAKVLLGRCPYTAEGLPASELRQGFRGRAVPKARWATGRKNSWRLNLWRQAIRESGFVTGVPRKGTAAYAAARRRYARLRVGRGMRRALVTARVDERRRARTTRARTPGAVAGPAAGQRAQRREQRPVFTEEEQRRRAVFADLGYYVPPSYASSARRVRRRQRPAVVSRRRRRPIITVRRRRRRRAY